LPIASENTRDIDERRVDLSAVVRTALQPGDVVFFHPLTPHRSGPNRSESNRESLFFTYVQPGHADLMERYYSARPQDFMSPD
jgi:ectoine hydroxylase-related dioxygenase (phytanoyl-CoA dioxygenase family)